MNIANAKFRRPVVPGDQLTLEADLINVKGGKYFSLKTSAYVDGNLVAEADLMAAMVPKENRPQPQ